MARRTKPKARRRKAVPVKPNPVIVEEPLPAHRDCMNCVYQPDWERKGDGYFQGVCKAPMLMKTPPSVCLFQHIVQMLKKGHRIVCSTRGIEISNNCEAWMRRVQHEQGEASGR